MAIKVELTEDDCALVFRGNKGAMEMIVPPCNGREEAPRCFIAMAALLSAAGILDSVMERAEAQLKSGVAQMTGKKDGDTLTAAESDALIDMAEVR